MAGAFGLVRLLALDRQNRLALIVCVAWRSIVANTTRTVSRKAVKIAALIFLTPINVMLMDAIPSLIHFSAKATKLAGTVASNIRKGSFLGPPLFDLYRPNYSA